MPKCEITYLASGMRVLWGSFCLQLIMFTNYALMHLRLNSEIYI